MEAFEFVLVDYVLGRAGPACLGEKLENPGVGWFSKSTPVPKLRTSAAAVRSDPTFTTQAERAMQLHSGSFGHCARLHALVTIYRPLSLAVGFSKKGVLDEIESQLWEGIFKKSDISYMNRKPRLEATVLVGSTYYIAR